MAHPDDARFRAKLAAFALADVLRPGRALAAVRLHPGDDRLLGGDTHRHDEAQVVAVDHVVQDRLPVLDERRIGILSQPAQLGPVVLAVDRVHEGVQEEIGARDPDVMEEVLHPGAGSAHEGAVAQRLVLRSLLPDDEDARAAIGEPAAVEHRAEVPAELLATEHGLAEAAVVRRLGKEPCPLPARRRPRVVLPGIASTVQKRVGHGHLRAFSVASDE